MSTRVIRPPAVTRGVVRVLCLLCLGAVIYGTIGPVCGTPGRWLAPRSTWSWVPPASPCDANDVLTNFVVYAPVGAALRLLVRRRGVPGWLDLLLAAALAVGLSYLTEVLQQFMPLRSSNLVDVFVNGTAALVGAWLAVSVQHSLRSLHAAAFGVLYGRAAETQPVPRPSKRRVWPVRVVAGVLLLAVMLPLAWPTTSGQSRKPQRAAPLVHWVPFRQHFDTSFPCAAADVVAHVAVYALVAALSLVVVGPRAGGVALVLVLGAAAAAEASQTLRPSHAADLTNVLLAGVGWLLAAGVARSLRPQPLPTAIPAAEVR